MTREAKSWKIYEKLVFSLFFLWNVGQNHQKPTPGSALIISDRSRAPGGHWMPFSIFRPQSLVYSIPTSSTPQNFVPCFIFPPGISPQDLWIRIKRKKLVWKAARISRQTPSHPPWYKSIVFLVKNHGFSILTFLTNFRIQDFTPCFLFLAGFRPQDLFLRIKH